MQEEEKNKRVLKALKEHEFVPFFQPQYNYVRKQISGTEVLSRWQDPERGIVYPGEFIPVLEKNGKIRELDYQVMEAACAQIAAWKKEGLELPSFSFNLSRYTALDTDLASNISSIVSGYGIEPSEVHLEVTESLYIQQYEILLSNIRKLKESGFKIEMDDFGSGYSSLGCLKNTPVDILKLDMSFLQMDENRGKGGSIISAMVRLSDVLDMSVIAEGVETIEQAEFLKSVGCYRMQGYFFAKPMNAEEYRKKLLVNKITVSDGDSFHEINKAVDFLDDTTQSALLFNSFVGGAMILEYRDGEYSLVRVNDQFFKIFEIERDEMLDLRQANLNIFDKEGQKEFISMLEEAIHTEKEAECEVCTDPKKLGRKLWLHMRTRCLARKKSGSYVFYVNLEDITERKLLDQENEDLTAELSSVINNTPGGFMRFSLQDSATQCEFLSEGCAWMFGYSSDELRKILNKEGYQRFVHPEDLSRLQYAVDTMKNDQRGRRLSYRIQKKDGSWLRVGSQNSIVNGLEGLSMFVYCWDETEQEKLREKLEVSSYELKNAISSLQGGTALYEISAAGTLKLIDISEEAAEITGRTPAEYLEEFAKDPLFCTYEADKAKAAKSVKTALETAKDFDVVYRVVHRNGSVIWVRLKAAVAPGNGENRLLYVLFSNLSANINSFDSLINEADTAVIVTDLNSHEILYANKTAAELGGITPEEALGHPCYQCLNQCSTIDQKCMAEIPPEGLELEEVRDGKVYRVRRKKMNWNGIEAGVCYISDRTDTILRENRLVDLPTIQAAAFRRRKTQKAAEEAQDTRHDRWENILTIMKKQRTDYHDLLTNDALRIRIQFLAVYAFLSLVSLFMTMLNLFQEMWKLAALTGIFALLSIANVVFALISPKTEHLAQILFGGEIIVLFTTFAITGNPEGFSILWSVLLPTLGMILYRRKYGFILSAVMWLILVFLFWTGFGRSLLQYDYTPTFLTRYPILYVALAGMGTMFEYIRKTTQDELVSIRKQFEHLYNHDALTGLYNRYGFNSTIESITKWSDHGNMAFAIMDLDSFKAVNDSYGHMNGDKVLKTTAMNIKEVIGDRGVVSRWGGEEFSVLFYKSEESEELCGKILQVCRNQEYYFDGTAVRVTISIGLVKFEGFSLSGSSDVITEADNNLYASKQNGKDRMTVTDLRSGKSC